MSERKSPVVSLILAVAMVVAVIPLVADSATGPLSNAGGGGGGSTTTRGGGGGNTGWEPWYYYVQGAVNAANGNLLVASKDVSVKARGFNLEVIRTYNGQLSGTNSAFGYGWTHNYLTRVVENADGSVTWWDGDGSQHPFTKSGGNYTAPAGIHSKLTKSNGLFTLWHKDGSTFSFDAYGTLATIKDKNGNKVHVTWWGGFGQTRKIVAVSDDSGLGLTFKYDLSNRITKITNPLNREVRYAYTSGDLMNVTDQLGNKTEYGYVKSHKMAGHLDPVGLLVNYTYDKAYAKVTKIDRSYQSVGEAFAPELHGSVSMDYVNATTVRVTNEDEHVTTITLNVTTGTPVLIDGASVGTCDASAACDRLAQTYRGCGCSASRQISESWALDWDDDRNVVNRTDAEGHTWSFQYDSRGNAVNVTDAMGNSTLYGWDNVDNGTVYISLLKNITNRRGYVTNYTYDNHGNLASIEDALGNISYRFYTSHGYMNKTIDFRGYATEYGYDIHGYIVNKTDATGNVTTYGVDSIGRRVNLTTPEGRFTQWVYDDLDRVVEIVDAADNSTYLEYDAVGDLVNRTDANGHSTLYDWNVTLGKIANVTDALGNVTRYEYDAVGNMVNATNRRNYSTTYTYDAYDRKTGVTDALGNATSYTYNADGTVSVVTDRRGYNTSFAYDANLRMTARTDALGNATSYSYDEEGNLVQIVNERGYNTSYEYDALDRRTKVTDASGNATSLVYDANGNLVNRTDRNGHSTTYAYDALDRRTKVTDPLEQVTEYTCDGDSLLTAVTDANDLATNYTHDSLGRVTQRTDATGNVTVYAYDALRHLVQLTDANNHTTNYSWDALYRLAKITTFLGHEWNLSYDAEGNVLQWEHPDGDAINYTHDALNRLARIDYPNGENATAEYNAEGFVVRATGFGYDRTDERDALNRVVNITFDYGNFSKSTLYTYDEGGNRATMTDGEGGVTTYGWDALDRLVNLTNPVGDVWTFAYDAGGRRTNLTRPNGVYSVYEYNDADWLTLIDTRWSNHTTLESFAYAHDAVGYPLNMTEADGDVTEYAYDDVYRLVYVEYPNATTVNYTYDGVGNRLSETVNGTDMVNYTYDADNRMLARGSTTYAYDDNGNLVEKNETGSVTSYEYAYDHRLVKVTLPNGTVVQYGYSPKLKRIHRTVDNERTWFHHDWYDFQDFEDLIGEYDKNGSLLRNYTHGPGIDEPLGMADGGNAYYFASQHLGTVTSLSDSTGTVAARYGYDPWGAAVFESGSVANPFRFTGREWDGDVGVYDYRARTYDPEAGRMTVPDAARLVWGASGPDYTYVRNAPTAFADPTGYREAGGSSPLGVGGGCAIACFNTGGGGRTPGKGPGPGSDAWVITYWEYYDNCMMCGWTECNENTCGAQAAWWADCSVNLKGEGCPPKPYPKCTCYRS